MQGDASRSIEITRAVISAQANASLAFALSNGLDDSENRELMHTTDAQVITTTRLTWTWTTLVELFESFLNSASVQENYHGVPKSGDPPSGCQEHRRK